MCQFALAAPLRWDQRCFHPGGAHQSSHHQIMDLIPPLEFQKFSAAAYRYRLLLAAQDQRSGHALGDRPTSASSGFVPTFTRKLARDGCAQPAPRRTERLLCSA